MTPNSIWNKKWKEIVTNLDGSVNIEQLKLELFDFEELIDRMISLTHAVTQGRLSYATYPVDTILEVMDQCQNENLDQSKIEDRVDGVCSLCEREFE